MVSTTQRERYAPMFYVEFVFANRICRNEFECIEHAIENAEHILRTWKTIMSVAVLGSRRENYPTMALLTKKAA